MGSAIARDAQNPKNAPDSGGARSGLAGEPIKNIIDDNERVRAAFRTPDSLARITGDGTRETAQTAVMVVTDRRVLFAADPSQSLEPARHSHSIPYAEVGAVSVGGDGEDAVSVATVDGDRWEFPLPETDPETVDAVVRHLRWVGELRSRLVSCRNDIELVAGEISDHVAEMAWEKAEATYEEARERLDRLILAVQWTKPIEDHVIAPELTEMERTLERAYAGLFIERGHSRLELATQLVDNENYEQAGTVLQSVREDHRRAEDRFDVITQRDTFQFGEQRELREELDRLGWEIDTVAAEPLRQAHEARIRADDVDAPPVAVERLETAFRRYGNVLSVALGDRFAFTGDRQEARQHMVTVGKRLVDGHRELADRQWDRAIDAEQNGALKEAIRACDEAIDHLERAEELATEFHPGEFGDIVERRERIQFAVAGLRENASVDAGPSAGPDSPPEGPRTDDAPEETGLGVDLLDIDTHQEIILETTLEEATDGGVAEQTDTLRSQHDAGTAEHSTDDSNENPDEATDENRAEHSANDAGDGSGDVPIMEALVESDGDET